MSPREVRSPNSPVSGNSFSFEAASLPSVSADRSFVPAVARDAFAQSQFTPNCEVVRFLLSLNAECSAAYTGEPCRSERQRYSAQHPTEILIFKCMDGRLHLTMMSNLPTGAVYPYRNIAGKFDLGWPALREEVTRKVSEATSKGHRVIALCAYHYSSGCRERGCRGMNFDTNAARGEAERLASQFQEAFAGGSRAAVIPIVTGIETDDEALVFEAFCDGSAKQTRGRLDCRDFAADVPDKDRIRAAVTALLPGVDQQLVADLVPIVANNALHIFTRRQMKVPIVSLNHEETVIAVGVGFDWLHVPNKAFIVGPYDHQWPTAVATAASVIAGNIRNKAIDPNGGIVLIASSYCNDAPGSWGWKLAEMTSRYYARVSQKAIADEGSLLLQARVHVLVGVVERATLEFHIVTD